MLSKLAKRKNIQPGVTVSLEELIKLRFNAAALDLSSKQLVASYLAGTHLSQRRGRGIDFNEVRVYQPGDDIRAMDWRVTARMGKPHTKLFHEEKERPVFLLMDFGPSMYFGSQVAFKSVIAAKIASILAWTTIKNHDQIGALIFSGEKHVEMRPRGRHQGVLPILKALADVSQTAPPATKAHKLETAFARLRRVTRPGSLIFIISDFSSLDENAERHLSQLSQHNECVACHIYDYLEKFPPPANEYAITDGDMKVNIDTGIKAVALDYHQHFRNHHRYVKEVLAKRNIPLLEFATHDPIMDSLLKMRRVS